jgi:hypothetical protein
MTGQERIRSMLEQRTRLEERIRKLGGTTPRPWPWDWNSSARNMQLLEIIEDLEKR